MRRLISILLIGLVFFAVPGIASAQQEGEAPSPAPASELDLWTVSSIASLVYFTGQMDHEALGHGGMCLATSGDLQGVSTSVLGCEDSEGLGYRLVAAGGTIADFAVGAGLATSLYLSPPEDGSTYYFMWLLSAVSLFQAGGYMMVFPWVPDAGDWGSDGVFRNVEPKLAWQLGVSAVGLGLTFGAIPLLNHLLEPLLGDGADRGSRRGWMTLLPYALGSTLITSGALLNRAGSGLGAFSAGAATFGGTLFLAYMPLFFDDDFFVPGGRQPGSGKPIPFSTGWVTAGAIAAVAAVAIFGPGIGGGFDEPHPLGLP